MGVVELVGIADHSPGIGVVAIQGGHGGPVRQIVFPLQLHRGAGVRVGIDLVAQPVALGVARVEIANRSIGIGQISRVGDDLQVHAGDEILGEDLRERRRCRRASTRGPARRCWDRWRCRCSRPPCCCVSANPSVTVVKSPNMSWLKRNLRCWICSRAPRSRCTRRCRWSCRAHIRSCRSFACAHP